MHVWVYIMDGAEIDRRVCAENRKGGQGYEEADRYEQDMRATRGKKWCRSWCTVENAVLIGYSLRQTENKSNQ